MMTLIVILALILTYGAGYYTLIVLSVCDVGLQPSQHTHIGLGYNWCVIVGPSITLCR